MVRTRTAPSPTGIPHIGNTWAALFNYLFAKKNKGKFILRLEDTDRERLVPESIDKIYETLHWLGIEYDEGPDVGGPYAPYVQSDRLDIYKKHLKELVDKSLAYEDNGAIRFKTTKKRKTSWVDLIGNKTIEFDNSLQEDFIIFKSDGYPTYHLASVIDDHLMEISYIIRGSEWISSTPKHIMLYKAFEWELPNFAHLPLILGPDKSKLSKRHGAKSVLELREEGYLKEALLNFMALLGWSPPSGKEILSIDKMIQEFDLKDVNLASPIFNIEKLKWFNKQYLMTQSPQNFVTLVSTASVYREQPKFRENALGTAPIIAPRISTLKEYDNFVKPLYEEPKVDKQLFGRKYKEHLTPAIKSLEEITLWDKGNVERALTEVVKNNKFDTGDFFMDLRIAITGEKVSMPINDLIARLDREKVVERLRRVLD